MQRPLIVVSLIGLLAAAPAAEAQMSYSYAQGFLQRTETDTVAGEQDGKGFEGFFSYDLLPFLHVFGGFRTQELDELPVDLHTTQAGVGFNFDISARQSVFINVAAIRAEADTVTGLGTIGVDDDGYSYAIGFREANHRRLEFQVSAEHIELRDSDYSDTWIDTSLQLVVAPRFRVEGGIRFLGEENVLRLGVRYYLPNPRAR